MFHDIETDLMRAWQLLHDISEQNTHNQKISSILLTRINPLKVRLTFFSLNVKGLMLLYLCRKERSMSPPD